MASEGSFSPEYLAENKGPSILGSTIAVCIASTLFAIARLFVRGKILKQLHLDDYLIIISVVSRRTKWKANQPATPSPD